MIYRTAQIFNDLGRRKSQISSHARHFLTLNISKKVTRCIHSYNKNYNRDLRTAQGRYTNVGMWSLGWVGPPWIEIPAKFVFNGTTLKSRIEVIQGHWKWHHSIDHNRIQ